MTINNPTGYYSNGEVEDYEVFVDGVLPVNLLSFTATTINNERVKLEWAAENEVNTAWYEIQRSTDGLNWQPLNAVQARNQPGLQSYTAADNSPYNGISYYRLRILNNRGLTDKYSETRAVNITGGKDIQMTVMPNPVKDKLQLFIQSGFACSSFLQVTDVKGTVLLEKTFAISKGGTNLLAAPSVNWPSGTYFIVLRAGEKLYTEKFTVIQ
jgi:hypothetical protein